ncbi:MAG: DUF1634 domain-containing protein [Thermoanaerobacteraceae bacterium]
MDENKEVLMEEKIKKEIKEMDVIISKALNIGVITSALIIFIGFMFLIITNKSGYPKGTYPISPIEIFKGAFMLKPYAIILAGLLLLIITPVFRVAVSIITYFREKDYMYTIITIIVFIILMISFFLGKVE